VGLFFCCNTDVTVGRDLDENKPPARNGHAQRRLVWLLGYPEILTPEEIVDRLEKRVGPKGRKLFERFLRQVNKLQMQQRLEALAQTVGR
jgi:hypothetical protein